MSATFVESSAILEIRLQLKDCESQTLTVAPALVSPKVNTPRGNDYDRRPAALSQMYQHRGNKKTKKQKKLPHLRSASHAACQKIASPVTLVQKFRPFSLVLQQLAPVKQPATGESSQSAFRQEKPRTTFSVRRCRLGIAGNEKLSTYKRDCCLQKASNAPALKPSQSSLPPKG